MDQRKLILERVLELLNKRKQHLDELDNLLSLGVIVFEDTTNVTNARNMLMEHEQAIQKLNIYNDLDFEKLIKIYSIMLGLVYGV